MTRTYTLIFMLFYSSLVLSYQVNLGPDITHNNSKLEITQNCKHLCIRHFKKKIAACVGKVATPIPIDHIQTTTLKAHQTGDKSQIKGNQDGENGRNETYNIGNRKNIPRKQAVKEVEEGLHPNYHIYMRDGEKFIRDNPDFTRKDNVNY